MLSRLFPRRASALTKALSLCTIAGWALLAPLSHAASQTRPRAEDEGGNGESQQRAQDSTSRLLMRLFKQWDSSATPGCVTAAKQNGRLLYTHAFGMADLERSIPNTPDTVFEIGSNSKQFTAAAVLLLVEEGKIKLDDDVRKYIPELPDYGTKITIDHLLTHTSGLRDWGEIATLQGWPRTSRAYTNVDAVDMITRQRQLNHTPGSRYSYTNSGYVLLPLIVERVSGTRFPAFTRDRIFAPLGMAQTQWRDDHNRVVKNRAIAYWKRGEEYSKLMPFEDVYGPGGLLTTVADMLIWNQALDDGRLGRFVTDELQREAISSDGRPIGYARGLFVGAYKGARMISHGGSTGAYQANLSRYPQQGLSFVLLCNADEVGTRGIEDQIVDHHLKLPPSPTNLPLGIDLTEKQLAERAGTYASESTGLLVTLSSDQGRLKWNGDRLQAISPSEFRTLGRRVVFDARNGFEMAVDNIRDRFRRVEGAPPKLNELSAIAGRYWSDEAATGYVLTVANNKLKIQNEQRSSFSAELEPVARDLFRIGNTVLRIERDAGSLPSAIVFSVPRIRALRFQRMSSSRPFEAQ